MATNRAEATISTGFRKRDPARTSSLSATMSASDAGMACAEDVMSKTFPMSFHYAARPSWLSATESAGILSFRWRIPASKGGLGQGADCALQQSPRLIAIFALPLRVEAGFPQLIAERPRIGLVEHHAFRG